MKSLVSSIVLLLSVSVAFSQIEHRTLINRIDHQSKETIESAIGRADESIPTSSSLMSMPLVQPTPAPLSRSRSEHIDPTVLSDRGTTFRSPASPQEKTFELTLVNPRLDLGLNDYGTISGHLKNLTISDLQLIFKRVQSIPAGWSTSVCFGDICYPDFVDSIPADNPYVLAGGAEAEFKLTVLTAPDKGDSILVYVLVSAVGSTSDDTVGLWMVVNAQEKESVGQTRLTNARPTIRSIYPSPLISGNAIKVNVECSREVGYRYAIYDPFGREIAFGTAARKLSSGVNLLSIGSLEGIGSGSYLLKLTFSDGTSDAYPFTVMR